MKKWILLCLFLLQSCQSIHFALHGQTTKQNQEAALLNTRLGMAYLKQGDITRAKRKILKALKQDQNAPNTHVAMAYILEKTGYVKEAEQYYQKALSLASGSGAQLNNYATFLCRQGQYKKADIYFIKAANDVHYEQSAIAYENAGLCALLNSDYKIAMRYFKKSLMQDGMRKQSLYEWVNIHMLLKQEHLALIRLKQYRALTLGDSTLLALAINVAHKAGDFEQEAEYQKQFQKYRSIHDDNNS